MEAMLKKILFATLCLALTACESPLSDVKEGANAGKAPANAAAPTISAIGDATTFLNSTKLISFTIHDADTALDCQRSVTVTSSNQSLFPGSFLTVAGSAPNCMLSMRPASGLSGTATITVTVFDGANRAATSFNLQVLPPDISVADSSASEGNALSFSVQLTQAASSTISVAYATADGTGVAGTNYSAASGTLTFAPGETVKTLNVATRDDGVYSSSKTIAVNFSAFGSTVSATGTILNIDPAIPVAFAISPSAFDEDIQSGLITLSYSVGDGALANACTISALSNVTVTQACACDGAGVCTLKVTGNANYHGAASFSYTVHANGSDSNTATASLIIDSVSDAPVANDFTPASFDADTESGLITLNYTAVGGDLGTSCAASSLNHVSVSQPCACDAGGVCTLKVTGATHYSGAASFVFTVSSGSAVSNTATASLKLNLVKTLALSFTGTTTLDPAITYSRTGGATRVNSSGLIETVEANVARVEYDPNALTLNGLLLEESRMNFLRLGSALDSALWEKSGSSVIGNITASPDGAILADRLVEDSSTSAHEVGIGSLTKPAIAAPYTFSVFAKAGERSSVHLYFYGASYGDSAGTVCTLSGAGSVSATSSTGAFSLASARIEAWPNGWYRCVITSTTSADSSIGAAIGVVSAGMTSYAGDGASGAYLWGAQLEAGAGATSIIPDKNFLTYSEQLDQPPWSASESSVTANSTADPAGSSGADTLSDSGTLNFHFAYQVVKTSPNQEFTYSFYAKAGTSDRVMAQINDDDSNSDNVNAKFDLTNGVVTNTASSGSGSGASASIAAMGNGWYRCSISGIASSGGARLDVRVNLLDSSGADYYTGGSGSVYIWGQQLEAGSAVSPYWPVTTGPVRGADQAIVPTLGAWFEASASTIVTSTKLNVAASPGVNRFIAAFTDGSASNVAGQFIGSSGGGERLIVAGSPQTDATINFTASGVNTLASAFQANDLQIYGNGLAGVASASASIPVVGRLILGSDGAGNYLNGWLRSLDYYPTRVPNAALGPLSQ